MAARWTSSPDGSAEARGEPVDRRRVVGHWLRWRERAPTGWEPRLIWKATPDDLAGWDAIIQGQPDVTLMVASQIVGHSFPISPHYPRHRLDLAHAYALTRDYGKAVGTIQRDKG